MELKTIVEKRNLLETELYTYLSQKLLQFEADTDVKVDSITVEIFHSVEYGNQSYSPVLQNVNVNLRWPL